MILEALVEVVGIVPDEVLLRGLSLDVLDDEVIGLDLNLVERQVETVGVLGREVVVGGDGLESVERDGDVVACLPYVLNGHVAFVVGCCLVVVATTAINQLHFSTEGLVLLGIRVQVEGHGGVHLVADRVGQHDV